MKQPVFTGVCTALVTPFINGAVNYPMMQQLLRQQIDAGISAVVISGTTGEASTLSDDEKLNLFAYSKAYVKDSCTVIAGTGSNSTDHAVNLSQAAEEAGADALLVVSPYYNKATTDGLVAHYMSIAHAVSVPIIIYNVPSRTGVDIPVSVYKRLSAIPNIAGVKEASTDITKVARIRNECGNNFHIWA
jgi:4-hydroxy-tetrahydrodipicolinate synthase